MGCNNIKTLVIESLKMFRAQNPPILSKLHPINNPANKSYKEDNGSCIDHEPFEPEGKIDEQSCCKKYTISKSQKKCWSSLV